MLALWRSKASGVSATVVVTREACAGDIAVVGVVAAAAATVAAAVVAGVDGSSAKESFLCPFEKLPRKETPGPLESALSARNDSVRSKFAFVKDTTCTSDPLFVADRDGVLGFLLLLLLLLLLPVDAAKPTGREKDKSPRKSSSWTIAKSSSMSSSWSWCLFVGSYDGSRILLRLAE